MSSVNPAGERTLLGQRAFLFFLASRSLSRFASQIAAVAIGWQVYDMTGRAFDLGMVGLVQFLPTAILLFVAGQTADRFERKRVVALCQLTEAATALFLAWSTFAGTLNEVQIFAATFVLGIAGAFESPALSALLPQIAPTGSLQRATAISSGVAQVATIGGPALGGLAYAVAPHLPYAIMLVFCMLAALLMNLIPAPPPAPVKDNATPDDVFAGIRFIRSDPAILGRSRSTCSRCCSAASLRCCRSTRAISCRQVRPGSACCAPRPRSARC
jgi:MFS family permease